MEYTRGPEDSDIESREICLPFDNVAQGLFYQRDWTSNGIPFVREETYYLSGWWYQFREDAEKLQSTFGGIGSWQEDFKERQKELQNKLNSSEEELEK